MKILFRSFFFAFVFGATVIICGCAQSSLPVHQENHSDTSAQDHQFSNTKTESVREPATQESRKTVSDANSISTEDNNISGNETSEHLPLDEQNLLEVGGYYDICLIRFIGSDKFESWLRDHPDSTVYNLIEDFGTTDEQLKEILAPEIYEAYMKYWPES